MYSFTYHIYKQHTYTLIYIYIYIYMLYCHLQHHNDTIIKTHAGRFLYKYMFLSLYLYGFEKVIQGLRVRGSWRPNRTAIFWLPLLWPSTLCHDAQLEAHGFLYCILSATSLDPNSSGPQGPKAWCGFPYHISSITPTPTLWNWNSNCLDFCLDWVI